MKCDLFIYFPIFSHKSRVVGSWKAFATSSCCNKKHTFCLPSATVSVLKLEVCGFHRQPGLTKHCSALSIRVWSWRLRSPSDSQERHRCCPQLPQDDDRMRRSNSVFFAMWHVTGTGTLTNGFSSLTWPSVTPGENRMASASLRFFFLFVIMSIFTNTQIKGETLSEKQHTNDAPWR